MLGRKNNINEIKGNVVDDAMLQSEYINDSDDVLYLAILLDTSSSVYEAGAFPIYNALLPRLKDIICSNPEARAKVKVAVACYGNEVREKSDFVPVFKLNTSDVCENLGATDTAAALRYAFERTKSEMERDSARGKRILRSIVFHVTDGAPTSTMDEMKEAIEMYDAFSGRGGKRKIQIFAATPDKNVARRLVYSDQTLLTEDYEGIGDAINMIASTASVLSSLSTTTNPITGEESMDFSEVEDGISAGEGILGFIPRQDKISLEAILG